MGQGIQDVGSDNKLDVTLVDALRIKELSLLIVSYLFRQTHNTFIKENPFYGATETVEGIYYYSGVLN